MGTLKLIMAVIFILSGCAGNPTEGMTPDEAEAYKVKAEYERQDYLIQKNESIIAARTRCKATNSVWIADGFSPLEHRKMKRDPLWIPRHASHLDFACMTQSDFRLMMDRQMRRMRY